MYNVCCHVVWNIFFVQPCPNSKIARVIVCFASLPARIFQLLILLFVRLPWLIIALVIISLVIIFTTNDATNVLCISLYRCLLFPRAPVVVQILRAHGGASVELSRAVCEAAYCMSVRNVNNARFLMEAGVSLGKLYHLLALKKSDC